MEDERIIELFWQREEAAIGEAEGKYGSYCRSIAYHILGSDADAEECLNDTWLHAWQSIPPARPARLRLYLGRIARNLAFDRYQHNTAQKRGGSSLPLVLEELEECLPAPNGVEQQTDLRALTESVGDFLRQQSPRNRRIFVQRYFHAAPVRDIARECGLREGHVSVLLSRMRKQLRTHLEKEGWNDET